MGVIPASSQRTAAAGRQRPRSGDRVIASGSPIPAWMVLGHSKRDLSTYAVLSLGAAGIRNIMHYPKMRAKLNT